MNIIFQDLKVADFELVKNIYDWYIHNSTATFHTEPITVAQLSEFIFVGHELYPAYLIFAGGNVAGYCYLTAYRNRQAYLRTAEITVYLKKDFTGKGVGEKALVHLEQQARVKGLKNLIATIAGGNHASIKLFEKVGYCQCAHFKNIGEKFGQVLDVVMFQKEI